MIGFSRHCVAPRELELVAQALASGNTSGDGEFTRRATRLLSQLHGDAPVLLTTSCTHALELSALLLGVGPGDEVVLPSFTFSSTANAFALRGCELRFADIDSRTFSAGAGEIESAVTPRTRVVVTVAYGGVLDGWPSIVRLCDTRGIGLVEDNAHGLFASFGGRALGTFGCLSALSFHATKNISCGEGGALVINDPALTERAEILREKGTDRARFFRGQVDKYTWRDIGSSYLPSDVLAAVLLAQLEHASESQRLRHLVWSAYRELLEPQAGRLGLQLQNIPDGVQHPAHVFAVLLPEGVDRPEFLRRCQEAGVGAVSHYEPLHLAPAYHGPRIELPNTERVAARLVRLPLHAALSTEEAAKAVQVFCRTLEKLNP